MTQPLPIERDTGTALASTSSEPPAAHPKIGRRPATWKRVTTAHQPAESSPTPPAHAHRPTLAWQDDMRFGMVMILAVFCINALLIWSTSTPHKKEESSLMIQQVTRSSVLPTPTDQSKQHVRSFTTPNSDADDEKLRIRSFMEEHARLLREMESPAPRASSIERGHE